MKWLLEPRVSVFTLTAACLNSVLLAHGNYLGVFLVGMGALILGAVFDKDFRA